MTTPQTDAGRHPHNFVLNMHAGMDEWVCDSPGCFVDEAEHRFVEETRREAQEHVLEVAARLLPPTDVDALRVALKEAQK